MRPQPSWSRRCSRKPRTTTSSRTAFWHGRQHQHGDPPPHRRQVLRHDGQVDPGRVGHQVERQPDAAHPGCERSAARKVGADPAQVGAERAQPLLGPDQEVGHEHHRHEPEPDPEQLVGQVQPGAPGRRTPIEHGLLAGQRLGRGEGGEQADDGVDPGLPQRQREDDPDLPDQHPAVREQRRRRFARCLAHRVSMPGPATHRGLAPGSDDLNVGGSVGGSGYRAGHAAEGALAALPQPGDAGPADAARAPRARADRRGGAAGRPAGAEPRWRRTSGCGPGWSASGRRTWPT